MRSSDKLILWFGCPQSRLTVIVARTERRSFELVFGKIAAGTGPERGNTLSKIDHNKLVQSLARTPSN